MYRKIPHPTLKRALPTNVSFCALLIVIQLVLVSLITTLFVQFHGGESFIRFYTRPARECHPQMLDQFWRLDLGKLQDLCDKYEDLYRMNSVLAGPSPYECKYTDEENASPPIPQFRVLGERHSGTNAISNLMYENFKGTLDKKTLRKGIGTHGPYKSVPPVVDMGITEHKHDEQTEYLGPVEDIPLIGVTVVAVRSPYDWIESMSRNIYGGQSRNKFKQGQGEAYKDAIERFLNTTWDGGDHIFETSYADIFELRYRKVCNHVASALKYSQHVMFLRHEDDVTDTSKLGVVEAVSRLGWPLNADNGDVDMLGDKYFGWSKSVSNWGDEDAPSKHNDLVAAVNRHADWDFERVLGYLQQTPARPATGNPKPVKTKAVQPSQSSKVRIVALPNPNPPTP